MYKFCISLYRYFITPPNVIKILGIRKPASLGRSYSHIQYKKTLINSFKQHCLRKPIITSFQ